MTKVNLSELITALKALKIHYKARGKLDVLIRRGERPGELILELSGRSKYAGILTTIRSKGPWHADALVPAGSLRGFIIHPPDDETTYLSFHVGTTALRYMELSSQEYGLLSGHRASRTTWPVRRRWLARRDSNSRPPGS